MAKDPGSKVCPILFVVNLENRDECLKTECAMYIKVKQELPNYDPERIMTYEGCGFVHVIPWNIVKRPDPPQGHVATLDVPESC